MAPLTRPTPALRTLVQTAQTTTRPTRPLLLHPLPARPYHSYETPAAPPYPPAETAILSSALGRVPALGFTQAALRAGAKDAGYLEASTNLFARGEFEMVLYHLHTQRLGLRDRVQFPAGAAAATPGTTSKVRSLVMGRVRANGEAGVAARWQEALGLMSLAGNIPASLKELYALADEIWFLAGDSAVDGSWYTKRASLAGVYAATEVYSTTDQSTDFRDTEAFLERRLHEVGVVGGAWRNVSQWVGYQGQATVNLARSWGARI